MKTTIEKVNKVKPFEPFIVKIQFDTEDEVRNAIYLYNNDLGEILIGELKKQGIVYKKEPKLRR